MVALLYSFEKELRKLLHNFTSIIHSFNIKMNALRLTLLISFTDDIDHTADFPRRRTMAEPTLPILPECPSGENSSVSRMDVSIHSGRDVDAETLQVMAEPTILIPDSPLASPSGTDPLHPPRVSLRRELFCIKDGCQHPQWMLRPSR